MCQTYNGENVMDTIVPSFLIGSSSNLQVTRTGIKSQTTGQIWLLLNFEVTLPWAHENAYNLVRNSQIKCMLERSLPSWETCLFFPFFCQWIDAFILRIDGFLLHRTHCVCLLFKRFGRVIVNFLNIRTPKIFVVITLKFELCGSTME